MIIAIVQARMTSRRFPGKVLSYLDGIPLLIRTTKMCQQAEFVNNVIVATSEDVTDDPIANICSDYNIKCFRGDLANVAKRYGNLLKLHPCEGFVRICADSPLNRSWLIDHMTAVFREKKAEIVTNTFKRSFPVGYSVEVVNSATFLKQLDAIIEYDAEHFTQIFYRYFENFRLVSVELNQNFSDLHLSIDEKGDGVKLSSALAKGIEECQGQLQLERFLNKHYAINQ